MSSNPLGPTLGDAASGVNEDTVNAFFEANEGVMDKIEACEVAICRADAAQVVLESSVEAMETILALMKSKLATL